jgi:hypothetical protein
MKRQMAFVLLTLLPILAHAQVDTAWVRRFDGGSHLLDSVAGIAVDQHGFNDTVDVGVTLISRPVGSVMPGKVAPQARVKNYGYQEVDFPFSFRLTRGTKVYYADTQQVVALLPNTERTVTFDTVNLDTGTFMAKAKCRVYGDSHPANDSMMSQVVATWPPPGWAQQADVPFGPKSKRVKDGGALAYSSNSSYSSYIYALKGGNTNEFYRFDVEANTWTAKETIPGIGLSGRKKYVKKGGSLCYDPWARKVYAVKGNNSLQFWCYDCDSDSWRQKSDVPLGTGRALKEGSALTFGQNDDGRFAYLLKGSNTEEFWRYDPDSNAWTRQENAPYGLYNKYYRDGSCLALYADAGVIYALKGSYDEFYAYDMTSGTWTTKTSLPMVGQSGRKKKVKSGAGMAALGNLIYALKGDNTQEFWSYSCDSDKWAQLTDIPLGTGKRVKGGGGLTASPRRVYALKGNNTLEFWMYGSYGPSGKLEGGIMNYEIQSSSFIPHDSDFRLQIAPNPFAGATAITYSLPTAGEVSLTLYNLTGQFVRVLVSGSHPAGAATLRLRTSDLSRGVYLLKLKTCDREITEKLVIE